MIICRIKHFLLLLCALPLLGLPAYADPSEMYIDFTAQTDNDYDGPLVTRIPHGFFNVGLLVEEGEWSEGINVDEMQGISHDNENYYLTNQWEIFKVSKKTHKVVAKNHLLRVNRFLKDGFYRHFGGVSCYGDYLYVATTGRRHPLTTKKAVPIIIVFDKELNFVKFGFLPEELQKGAAWVAVNPANGHLYSSYGQVVYEYSRDFRNGETLNAVGHYVLNFRHADLSPEEWEDAVAQGGTFSGNGVLFYVLDLKHSAKNASTGIHAFALHDSEGDEIDLWGLNNKGELHPFISIRYIGSRDGERFWEMEDLTFGRDSIGEYIGLLQLRNGKKDEAQVVHYRLLYDIRKALDDLSKKFF